MSFYNGSNPKTCQCPESRQCTEKTFVVVKENNFLSIQIFLCQFTNTCTIQIFQTTFYDFLINQKLKVCQVSFIVQNLASMNEPRIFFRKIFFKKIEKYP